MYRTNFDFLQSVYKTMGIDLKKPEPIKKKNRREQELIDEIDYLKAKNARLQREISINSDRFGNKY